MDLLWQTDELRIAKPDVVDEARNAVWYLDGLHADAVPHVLEELADELSRLGLELAPDARPLAFGTWIGGDRDGNPNVSPDAHRPRLVLQHDYGLRDAIAVVDVLRRDLSVVQPDRGRDAGVAAPAWHATWSCSPRWRRASCG